MKPLFQKEVQIKSLLTYQNFLKKGYRLVPKLTLKFIEKSGGSIREARKAKNATKKKIMRIFKNTKAIKKLDLSGLKVFQAQFWFPAFLYIAKKMSKTVSDLKVHDSRKRMEGYTGLVTSWPKYMRHLKSLSSEVFVDDAFTEEDVKKQKKIKPMTSYLKYMRKLTMIEITFSHTAASSDFNGIWQFEKYPASIKRIHFNQTMHGKVPMNTSMAHLKNLKELRFSFGNMHSNSIDTLKSALCLIPQVPQLEALEIDFVTYFELDASIRAAFKSAKKLKKVKVSLYHEMHLLPVLKCLEGSPLEDFDLSVDLYNEKRVFFLNDFLKKKKNLKSLKLQITHTQLFQSLKEIQDLMKTIDDLPQLTSLDFEAKSNQESKLVKAKMLPEINFPFEKIFGLSRSTPLKKFRISMNQHSFSQNGFMKLLRSLKGISPNLEELQIDVGEYKPKENIETEIIIEFIKNLKSIRILKLGSLDISQKQFFFEVIETIESLKFLKAFSLGELSGDLTAQSCIDGIRKVLLKKGLEEFHCEMSEDLQKIMLEKDCPRIDREEILRKNPSHEKEPFRMLFLNNKKIDEFSW